MYRVITKYHDGRSGRPTIERGPWHQTHETAQDWADILRHQGYITEIESQRGQIQEGSANDNSELASALASMA